LENPLLKSAFEAATTWSTHEPGILTAHPDASWTQGRALFGGFLMAGALRGLEGLLPADRSLRSVLTSFAAPVQPAPFECRLEVIRAGSSFTHTQARILQNGQVCMEIAAGYGTQRPPGQVVAPPEAPKCEGPEVGLKREFMSGVTPEFVRHFEVAIHEGYLPYSGRKTPGSRCWLREKDGAGHWNALKLIAMLDVPPPPIWSMLTGPARGSTIHFQATVLDGGAQTRSGKEWLLFDAQANASDGAYCDYRCGLWADDGTPLIIGKQVFADFSGKRG